MSQRTTSSQSASRRAAPKTQAKAALVTQPPNEEKTAARSKSPASRPHSPMTPDRYHLISEAAYYRAEHRGFAAGGELSDWLEAEAEVDALLNSRGTA